MSGQTKKELQAEVKRLQKELKQQKSSTVAAPAKHRVRSSVKRLAFSLACAILVVANLTFYMARTLVETEKFSAAASEIIKQPAVQDAIATKTTEAIYQNIDVENLLFEALPEKAQPVAPFLATGVEKFTYDSTKKILANDSFQEGATKIITVSHSAFIEGVRSSNGDGNINVDELYNAIGSELQNTKLAPLTNKDLPDKVGEIQVFEASWLPTLHNLVNNLNTIRVLTFVFVVFLFGLFIWLSKNRRRATTQIGIAILLLGLFTLMALNLTESLVVGKAVNFPQAASEIWAVLTAPLITQTVGAMVTGLGLAIVAWIGGSSKIAKSTRSRIETLFNGKAHSALFKKENSFTVWTANHKKALHTSIGVLFVLALALITVTTFNVIFLASIGVVLSLLVEVIASPKVK